MAEHVTVARPYARAVFELAREAGSLDAWSEKLARMAAVASEPVMRAAVRNPRVRREEAADVFVEVCARIGEDGLDEGGRNLVKVLAHHRRLDALPAIAAQFERLRSAAEQIVEAELETALPASEAQRSAVVEALESRFGGRVNLVCRTNDELIGGAVIRAGDWVVDGSVRAQLARLAGALGAAPASVTDQ